MQDESNSVRAEESGASEASVDQATPVSTQTSPAPESTTSAAPAPGAKRSLRDSELWAMLGLLLLFFLLLPLLSGIGGNNRTLTAAQDEMVSLVQKVNPSVVQVVSKRAVVGATGSGEIFTSDGYIVTNSHVVHGFSDYSVVLADNRTIPARLVADVVQEDLAVLKISADNLTPIAIGDSSKVQVGRFRPGAGQSVGTAAVGHHGHHQRAQPQWHRTDGGGASDAAGDAADERADQPRQ